MAEKLLTKIKKGLTAESKSKTKETPLIVAIDYPREGDTVLAGHYAIRLSGMPDCTVQLSINGKDWQACRFAAGYFWYDWWPAKPGKTTMEARTQKGKGQPKSAPTRSCTVVASGRR